MNALKPQRARGFTLLELLVAISVLSVVSVIAWRGLDSLVATRERLEPEVDETRAMLVAFGQMERDLSQVVNPDFLGLATSPLNVRPVDGATMIEGPAGPSVCQISSVMNGMNGWSRRSERSRTVRSTCFARC